MKTTSRPPHITGITVKPRARALMRARGLDPDQLADVLFWIRPKPPEPIVKLEAPVDELEPAAAAGENVPAHEARGFLMAGEANRFDLKARSDGDLEGRPCNLTTAELDALEPTLERSLNRLEGLA